MGSKFGKIGPGTHELAGLLVKVVTESPVIFEHMEALVDFIVMESLVNFVGNRPMRRYPPLFDSAYSLSC